VAYDKEGEKVNFSCISHGRANWYHYTNPITKSNIITFSFPDTYTITIPNVNLGDDGQYMCKGYKAQSSIQSLVPNQEGPRMGTFEASGLLLVGSESMVNKTMLTVTADSCYGPVLNSFLSSYTNPIG